MSTGDEDERAERDVERLLVEHVREGGHAAVDGVRDGLGRLVLLLRHGHAGGAVRYGGAQRSRAFPALVLPAVWEELLEGPSAGAASGLMCLFHSCSTSSSVRLPALNSTDLSVSEKGRQCGVRMKRR